MKTLNIFKSVVIAVISMISVSANAQTKVSAADSLAYLQDQQRKFAYVHGANRGKANDAESTPIVEDGILVAVNTVRHNRMALNVGFGGSMIHGESELENKTATTGTLDISLEYTTHKKDAIAGFHTSVDLEINSKVKFENRETTALGIFVNGGLKWFPCSKFNFTTDLTLGYLNSTSQRYIKNDVAEGFVDYKGNPLYVGGSFTMSYPLFNICKTKVHNVEGQKITGKAMNPVNLFVKCRVGTTEIGKPKVNNEEFTWKGFRTTVLIGLSFTM